MIDLRSDTLTKPSQGMIEYMFQSKVGDEAYGEDENVIELQNYCKNFFDKEDALYTASGTMSNQIALRVLASPGNDVLLDRNYHLNYFESSSSSLSQVGFNFVEPDNNQVISVNNLESAIYNKGSGELYSKPNLLVIENTMGTYQGKVFPLDRQIELFNYCKSNGINVYVDGARLINASVSSGVSPKEYAKYCDALSICFSKGLSAPFGSMLVGSSDFIKKAKVWRKRLGGGFHQIGFMASAALYAMRMNIEQLEIDHKNAYELYSLLIKIQNNIFQLSKPESNMVFLKMDNLSISATDFIEKCKIHGLLLGKINKNTVRIVYSSISRSENVAKNTYNIIKSVLEIN